MMHFDDPQHDDEVHAPQIDPTHPVLVPVEFALYTDVNTPNVENTVNVGIWSSPNHERYGGHLFVLADGYGPGRRGELASQLTVKQTGRLYYQQVSNRPTILAALALEHTLRRVSLQLYQQAYELYADGVMGAAVIAVVVRKRQITLAWLGNCRAYYIPGRSSLVSQINQDYFLHQDSDEVWEHQSPGVLGIVPEVTIRTKTIPVEPGDTLLLTNASGYHYLQPDGYKEFLTHHEQLEGVVTAMAEVVNRHPRRNPLGLTLIRYPERRTEREQGAGADPEAGVSALTERLGLNAVSDMVTEDLSRKHRDRMRRGLESGLPPVPLDDGEAGDTQPLDPQVVENGNGTRLLSDADSADEQVLADTLHAQWLIDPSMDEEQADDFIKSGQLASEADNHADAEADEQFGTSWFFPETEHDAVDSLGTRLFDDSGEVDPLGTMLLDDPDTDADPFAFADDEQAANRTVFSEADSVVHELFALVDGEDGDGEHSGADTAPSPQEDSPAIDADMDERESRLQRLADMEQALVEEFDAVTASSEAYEPEPEPEAGDTDAPSLELERLPDVEDEGWDTSALNLFASEDLNVPTADSFGAKRKSVRVPDTLKPSFSPADTRVWGSDIAPPVIPDFTTQSPAVDDEADFAAVSEPDAPVYLPEDTAAAADEDTTRVTVDKPSIKRLVKRSAPDDGTGDGVLAVDDLPPIPEIVIPEREPLQVPEAEPQRGAAVRRGLRQMSKGAGGVIRRGGALARQRPRFAVGMVGGIVLIVLGGMALFGRLAEVSAPDSGDGGRVTIPLVTATVEAEATAVIISATTVPAAAPTDPPVTVTPFPTASPYPVPNDWREGTVLYITEATGLYATAFSDTPLDPDQFVVGDRVEVTLARQAVGYREWYDAPDGRWWYINGQGWLPEAVLSAQVP